MTEYRPKYKHNVKTRERIRQGYPERPDRWITGPDPIEHDKYYGYMKHKAQAKFRGEDYSLTWEDWQDLWPHDKWLCRGRGKEDLCLMQSDPILGWHNYNVEVVTRHTYLKRAAEYKKL